MRVTLSIDCTPDRLHEIIPLGVPLTVVDATDRHLQLRASLMADGLSDTQGTALLASETSGEEATGGPPPTTGTPPRNLDVEVLDLIARDGPMPAVHVAEKTGCTYEQARDVCRALADDGRIRSAGNRGWQVTTTVNHDAARARAAEAI